MKALRLRLKCKVAPFAEQSKNPGYIPWTILSPLNYALPPLP